MLRTYLSVAEADDYLHCSRQRVYDLCSKGTLPRLRDRTRVPPDRAEIDAYLAAHADPDTIRRPGIWRS